ncbi:hypothetical protein Zmor_016259 [Zophobas morio]|uniref:Uncharacterized protein n=1 Tax=Zophobas morio TaxID=2755281 RepID=A0AA38MIB5_9CUCU|nr:hypothetical protein Zmor_016259 [Zophobas morio]
MRLKWLSLLAVVILTTSSAKSSEITFRNVTLINSAGEEIVRLSSSSSLKENLPDERLDIVVINGNIPILFEDSIANISTIKQLRFLENGIEEIRSGAFKNLTGVQSLDISYSILVTLKNNTFRNLTVEELSVEHSGVTKIELCAFNYLPKLHTLSLLFNNLQTLEEEIFNNLSNLQNLELSFNFIRHFPDNIFKKIPKLKSVFIRNNKIEQLSQNAFRSNTLSYLDLSGNRIATITEGAFNDLPRLSSLILSFNHLTKITEGVFTGQSLNHVILSHNKISSVTSGAFKTLSHLEKLSLEFNRLTLINPQWFQNLINLHQLNFGHNRIREIPDKAFRDIQNDNNKRMDLSHNRINNISSYAFSGLKFLDTLDLSYNEIENWDVTLLADVERIRHLNLFQNKIKCPEGNFHKIFKARFTYLGFNLLTPHCLRKIVDWRLLESRRHVVCTKPCSLS